MKNTRIALVVLLSSFAPIAAAADAPTASPVVVSAPSTTEVAQVADAQRWLTEFRTGNRTLTRMLRSRANSSRGEVRTAYRSLMRCLNNEGTRVNRYLRTYATSLVNGRYHGVIHNNLREALAAYPNQCAVSGQNVMPALFDSIVGPLPGQSVQAAQIEQVAQALAAGQQLNGPAPIQVAAEEPAAAPAVEEAPTPVVTAQVDVPVMGSSNWIESQFPGERPQSDSHSISAEQAQSLFPQFGIQYNNGRASLRGRVFAACRSAFRVENSARTSPPLVGSSENGETIVGFRILDESGAGRRCMQALGAQGGCQADEFLPNGQRNPRFCVSLATLDGASGIDFGLVPTGRLGLIGSRDPNSESDAPVGYGVGDGQHRAAAEVAAERAEASRVARERRIVELAGIAQSCRDTAEDRDAANSAIEQLTTDYDSDEVSSLVPRFNAANLLTEIRRSALTDYRDLIDDADMDELSDLRSEILALLNQDPELSDEARRLFERIANRYVELAEEDPSENREAYAEAREALSELGSSGHLSRREVARIRSARRELSALELDAAAQGGMYDQRFWQMWRRAFQSSRQDLMSACYGASTGRAGMSFVSTRRTNSTRSMEACSTATESYQRVWQSTSIAQNSTIERLRTEQQMQQEMNARMQQMQASLTSLHQPAGGLNLSAGVGTGSGTFLNGTIGQSQQFPATMPLNSQPRTF